MDSSTSASRKRTNATGNGSTSGQPKAKRSQKSTSRSSNSVSAPDDSDIFLAEGLLLELPQTFSPSIASEKRQTCRQVLTNAFHPALRSLSVGGSPELGVSTWVHQVEEQLYSRYFIRHPDEYVQRVMDIYWCVRGSVNVGGNGLDILQRDPETLAIAGPTWFKEAPGKDIGLFQEVLENTNVFGALVADSETRCKRCRSPNVVPDVKMMRGGDEGYTVFWHCKEKDCKHVSKENS